MRASSLEEGAVEGLGEDGVAMGIGGGQLQLEDERKMREKFDEDREHAGGRGLNAGNHEKNGERQGEDGEAGEDEGASSRASSVRPPGLPFSKMRCIALVLTVATAAFLNTLGVQAAVIILPTIGRELKIPESRQQWIISAYNLTFGCFLLLWGRLGDVYGKRLIFIWGSAWLTVTSLILPFMPNEIAFDVFRGLQGLGAAAMVPTAIGIIGVTFPPGKAKNYAFSCYGAGAPLGGVFGNIFGGVLGQYLNWRWVFWIFACLAAIVTVVGWFVIPLPPLQRAHISMRRNVDWVGGTMITVGILILLFALTEGNVVGWKTPWVPTLIVVAVLIIAAFVVWQWWLERRFNRAEVGEGGVKKSQRPLMKVSIFKNRRVSGAIMIMLLFFASFNNFLIVITYWFQDYQGHSIIETTIRFIPSGVTGVLVAFVTAHLLARVRGDFILTFGMLSISMSSLLLAIPIPTSTSYWAYAFPALVLSVCGADTMFPILMLFTAKSLPQEDQALGGALINSVGQVGRAIGLAIMTAVQTAIIAKETGQGIDDIGKEGGVQVGVGSNALKVGLRGASWFNFGIGISALLVVVLVFRGAGKIGGKH